jgi:hypothetical protein
MSGLTKRVNLEAKKGQIIISKASNSRQGWKEQIKQEITAHSQPALVDDYGDMYAEIDATISDGLQ